MIQLSFSNRQNVALQFDIINALGQIVKTIDEKIYPNGENIVTADINNLKNGIYLIRASSKNYSKSIVTKFNGPHQGQLFCWTSSSHFNYLYFYVQNF